MPETGAPPGIAERTLPPVDSPDRTLLDLHFPALGRKPYPSTFQRALVFAFIVIMFALIEGVVAYELTRGAALDGPGGPWGFALVFGFVGFYLGLLGFIVVWYRGFGVEGGVMTLPTPQRVGRGRRLRRVQLLDIVDAEPINQPVPNAGLLLTLRDGSQFRLWVDYASRMQTFLDQLLAVIELKKRSWSMTAERPLQGIRPPSNVTSRPTDTTSQGGAKV